MSNNNEIQHYSTVLSQWECHKLCEAHGECNRFDINYRNTNRRGCWLLKDENTALSKTDVLGPSYCAENLDVLWNDQPLIWHHLGSENKLYKDQGMWDDGVRHYKEWPTQLRGQFPMKGPAQASSSSGAHGPFLTSGLRWFNQLRTREPSA